MLVTEAVKVLAVVLGLEGDVAVGNRLVVCFVLADGVGDLDNQVRRVASLQRQNPYPKVNIQTASSTKFAIANLERDRHLVVAVEVFVETFAAMSRKLDVVGNSSANQAAGA